MTHNITLLDSSQLINITSAALRNIDENVLEHGDRVAYIAYKILESSGKLSDFDMKTLIVSALFHDVGAYRYDNFYKLTKFDVSDTQKHCVTGYLFFKHMGHMPEIAEIILHHHDDFNMRTESDTVRYSQLIYLADRIDVLMLEDADDYDFSEIFNNRGIKFDPYFCDMFAKTDASVIAELKDKSYVKKVRELMLDLEVPVDEVYNFLEMLIYAVDFISRVTVTHTITTSTISICLGELMGLNAVEVEELFLGSIMHDIGKTAIPAEILESPQELTREEFEVMKMHVEYTGRIIKDNVTENIYNNACRHHEKIDGSGYPFGLTGEQLTLSQRILAVSDTASALLGKRSYKPSFDKPTTIGIIKQMMEDGKLCPKICNVMIENFDYILGCIAVNTKSPEQAYLDMENEFEEIQLRGEYVCGA